VRPELLTRVLDVLAGSTGADSDCFHAVWERWGWEATGGVVYPSAPRRTWHRPPPAPPMRRPCRPRYWPIRGCIMRIATWSSAVPLHAALRVGHDIGDWFHPQSPSLLWPTETGCSPARSTSTPPSSAARPN
jgi:hypothetical protein